MSTVRRQQSDRRTSRIILIILLILTLGFFASTPLPSAKAQGAAATQYGLDWPGTGTARRMLYWHNPFPIYDATYIFKVYPRAKTSANNSNNNHYYTTFFWGNDGKFEWDSGNNANTYYGAHPYPRPAPLGPAQWEVSVASKDITSGTEVDWNRWHTQAFRAWRESAAITHHEFYYDWPDLTKVIKYDVNTPNWASRNPPNPAIVIGQAPNFNGLSWGGYPGWEEFNGIIRGIQIYSGLLSLSDIQAEINSPESSATGRNFIWYLNLDPRLNDTTDKKSSGVAHNPSWDGTSRPTEWSNSSATPPPPPPPSDTTPPSVSVSSPAAGSVSGNVTVTANASDDTGVAGVQFKLDNVNLGSEDTSNPYSTTWNSTTASNGSHTLTAVARDAAGNTTTSAAVTVNVNNAAPDTTAPVISGISTSAIGSNSATVSWNTDEASNTQIDYGTTASYGSSTSLNSSMVVSHAQTLSGLAAGATYHFRVKSRDAAGNLATSGDAVFTTTPPDASGVHVNFQPAGAALSAGYLVDSGLPYGVRNNGYAYGWNVNADPRTRNNSLSPDPRYDSLVHMGNAVWEMALPNGTYDVHVVVGDPNYGDVVSRLTVEGVPAITGNTTASNRWLETTVTVTVNDGALTVGNQAGSYNKICYIDISAPAGSSNSLAAAADTNPPAISGMSASGISDTGATIAWTTNEAADSQVEYGTTAGYGAATTLDPAMVASHSQTLGNLLPGTTYHFRVKSTDAAGNPAVSADAVFTTTSSGPTGTSVHINFQPAAPAPDGYLVDSGLWYDVRSNGYSYGWSAMTDPRARNNSQSPDARYDTMVHMGNAVWEMAVPNGTYTVHVVVGDASYADVVSKLTVEGTLAVNGTTSDANRWLEATVTVTVNDGKLTIGNQPGSYNKICFIDITTP